MKKNLVLLAVFALVITMTFACGPRQYTKGKYSDPNVIMLLTDKFSENDLQLKTKENRCFFQESQRVNNLCPVCHLGLESLIQM